MAPKPPSKPRLTHFLCVPLVTASSAGRWRASLDKFIADATGTQPDSEASSSSPPSSRPSIPARAIRPLHSLHLTLGVMSLENAESVEDAIRALHEADVKGMLAEIGGALAIVEGAERRQGQQVTNSSTQNTNPTPTTDSDTTTSPASGLKFSPPPPPSTKHDQHQHQPLHLTLRSLHPMHSPSRTSILYASPEDPSNRLFPFCSRLRDHFTARSLLVPDDRPLKLHATIVNTLYARSDTRKSGEAKRAKAAKKLPKGWGRPAERRGGGATSSAPAGDSAGNPSASTTTTTAADPPAEGADVGADVGADAGAETGASSAMDRNGRIDARELVARWDGFVWAEVVLDRVAICEMGAKPDDKGVVRYKEVAVAEL